MVRPRLVEEGVPIGSSSVEWSGGNGTYHGNSSDHRMMDEPSFSHPQHLPPQAAENWNSNHPQRHQQQQSSLLKAAGGRIAHSTAKKQTMPPKRATHIVIGADSSDHIMDDSNGGGEWNDSPSAHHASMDAHCYHREEIANASTSFDSSSRYGYNRHPTQNNHLKMAHSAPITRTHVEIGADERVTEKMQGVEDHGLKEPLVVLDGANVAYAYASALQELQHYGSRTGTNHRGGGSRLEPNMRGLQVAVDYFGASLRVLVVLPQSYYRRKQAMHGASSSASMFAPQQDEEQLHILEELHRQGRLVAAPPSDDDDAYALFIARRENARAAQRHGVVSSSTGIVGPAYVLSNDLFRDAQQRDATGSLGQWLVHGLSNELGPGRISFAFCDLGRLDDHGDPELDIVPNPRHPLVAWIEARQHELSAAGHRQHSF
jgi:Zc3h12a-like Ribonuclease NYN domain